jgi:hypothetical protein
MYICKLTKTLFKMNNCINAISKLTKFGRVKIKDFKIVPHKRKIYVVNK